MKYFSPETDPGIDFERADPNALIMLDVARGIAGVPFKVTRSYSTPEHSVAVGGKADDAHTKVPTKAFDIEYWDTLSLWSIVMGCIKAGFTRIGINYLNHHVHADCELSLPNPRLWIEGVS